MSKSSLYTQNFCVCGSRDDLSVVEDRLLSRKFKPNRYLIINRRLDNPVLECCVTTKTFNYALVPDPLYNVFNVREFRDLDKPYIFKSEENMLYNITPDVTFWNPLRTIVS